MDTSSFWEAISTRTTYYPVLNGDIKVDVAIIGGGITGVTAAHQLISTGKTVAIIEANSIGSGTTGNSTGNLYIPVQPFYQSIVSKFDFETAKKVAWSRKLAIDYIENQVKEKNITCNFSRRPWYAYTTNQIKYLEAEVELLQRMDINIEFTSELPLPFKFKRAVVMPNQARFNPLQYVISMAADLKKQGCHIFENTRALKIHEDEHCDIETDHGNIRAQKVLLATHTPLNINLTQLYTAPYRSYVVAVKLQDEKYPEGHFWDLDCPKHATCTHGVNNNVPEILMVAGSHHKTGQGEVTPSHYQELESFLKDHVNVSEVAFQWSAQHYQSADNIPYIGPASHSSKHTYMATGYWADGLIYGTLAGMIIGDMILENDNLFSALYESTRKKLIASTPFTMREGSNILIQYLKDFPIFSAEKFANIKKGEGKVISISQEKYAVSRDDNDQLHVVSAVCTHMKCIVNWNAAEKTWDCPCHGSRFTCKGEVIEGPATEKLESKQIQQ